MNEFVESLKRHADKCVYDMKAAQRERAESISRQYDIEASLRGARERETRFRNDSHGFLVAAGLSEVSAKRHEIDRLVGECFEAHVELLLQFKSQESAYVAAADELRLCVDTLLSADPDHADEHRARLKTIEHCKLREPQSR